MIVPMNEVQELERGRRVMLFWYIGWMALASVGQVLHYTLPDDYRNVGLSVTFLTIAVGLGWGGLLCAWLYRLYRRSADERKAIERALCDERFQKIRLLAWRDAFFAVLGATVLLGIPGTEHPNWLNSSAITQLILGIGCVTMAVSLLWRDRENGGA